MPVINFKFSPHPAPAYKQAFVEGLSHLYELGRIPLGLKIQPDPAPIYVLGLKRNAPIPAQPSEAQLVGWRFFASDLSDHVAAGDVSATTPPKLTGLIYGDAARDALKAMSLAKNHPDIRAKPFEMRLLRIPGALVQGFWFKPSTDESGLFVQYRPVFEVGRDSDLPTSLDAFLGDLRPVDPPPRERPSSRRDLK